MRTTESRWLLLGASKIRTCTNVLVSNGLHFLRQQRSRFDELIDKYVRSKKLLYDHGSNKAYSIESGGRQPDSQHPQPLSDPCPRISPLTPRTQPITCRRQFCGNFETLSSTHTDLHKYEGRHNNRSTKPFMHACRKDTKQHEATYRCGCDLRRNLTDDSAAHFGHPTAIAAAVTVRKPLISGPAGIRCC